MKNRKKKEILVGLKLWLGKEMTDDDYSVLQKFIDRRKAIRLNNLCDENITLILALFSTIATNPEVIMIESDYDGYKRVEVPISADYWDDIGNYVTNRRVIEFPACLNGSWRIDALLVFGGDNNRVLFKNVFSKPIFVETGITPLFDINTLTFTVE
jgi:hypothetical protein